MRDVLLLSPRLFQQFRVSRGWWCLAGNSGGPGLAEQRAECLEKKKKK